jgi:putative flippase GtrA
MGARQFRYVLVGALCALVHNLVLIGGDAIGWHYVVSIIASYLIVVALGYGLHTRYTFRSKPSALGFFRYAVPMAANFPASVALMFVLVDLIRLPVWIAAPIGTVVLFIANYVITRWALLGMAPKEDARHD